MLTSDRRLVRVANGLYRGEVRSTISDKWEDGGIRFSHFPWSVTGMDPRGYAKSHPWRVEWKDWMCNVRELRFKTLKAARAWFLTGGRA